MPISSRDEIHPRPRLTLAAAIIAAGVGVFALPGHPTSALASPLTSLATTSEKGAPESHALAARFESDGYDWDSVLAGDAPVPEVSVRTLPKDLARVQDLELKKSLFFRSLLPMALQVNREIGVERKRVLRLKKALAAGRSLDIVDEAWLVATAEAYGGDPTDLDDLLRRVDGVPPSLVLAQAAEESGWGTSRFVREGNALFGQYTWSDGHDGIVPGDNAEGDTIRRVRVFANVKAAVASYAHNLNSHPAYENFRRKRASGGSGYELIAALDRYSERRSEYVATIRTIMRVNRLAAVDQAELANEIQVSQTP